MNAGLLETDDARVGQIIFRSKAVRRIDEESTMKAVAETTARTCSKERGDKSGDDQEQHSGYMGSK